MGTTFAIVLSAALFAASLIPRSLGLPAWFALVPLLVVLQRASLSTRGTAAIAAAWALLVAALLVGAPHTPLAARFALGPTSAWGLTLALLMLVAVPPMLAFAFGFGWFARRCNGDAHLEYAFPLVGAALWVAIEWLRIAAGALGEPFASAAIGALGTTQLAQLPIAQSAAWTGVYGPSFLVFAVNAALAQLWLGARARRGFARVLLPAAVPVALVLLVALAGRAVLSPTPESGVVSVAAVQNPHPALRPSPDGSRERSARFDAATLRRARHESGNQSRAFSLLARHPEIHQIFWPFPIAPRFLEDDPNARRRLGQIAARGRAQIVAPGSSRTPRGAGALLVAIDARGAITARAGDGSDATNEALLDTPIGRGGVLFSNQALQGGQARRRTRAGATYLVNVADDLGLRGGLWGHAQLAALTFRAIEVRRSLVVAATAGPSALIDPYGRVLARTPVGETTTWVGPLARRSDRSLYTRIGDAFALGCAAVVALLAVRLRRKGSAEAHGNV